MRISLWQKRDWLRNDASELAGLLVNAREPFIMVTIILFLVMLIGLGVHDIAWAPRQPMAVRWLATGVYLIGLVTLGLARAVNNRRIIQATIGVALGCILVLGLTFALTWSVALSEIFVFVMVFRLPRRWSLPLILIDSVLFAWAQLHLASSSWLSLVASASFWTAVSTIGGLGLLAMILRSLTIAIQQLEATQHQLHVEIARTAELTAMRERTRIAHDMHDVLAHSLTMISMQVQATRQLVRREPERTEAMLDDMATVLRESIAESRHLITLLRTGELDRTGSLFAQARTLAERFSERVGMQIAVHEEGSSQPLEADCEAAILYVVREALTNAFRHGAAQQAWVELQWHSDQLALTVRDDGTPQPGTAGGGNGLRGMQARADQFRGKLQVGPRQGGGFQIAFQVPIASGSRTGVCA